MILYGGNNNWFAAYAYWYFKLYGHRDVRLLDGGRKKWELDGRPLSSEKVTRPATDYVASEPVSGIRAHRDEVIEQIGRKNIVDVRSPDEFSGKILAPAHVPQEQPQVPGHVPTAVNVPWSKTAADDGTFLGEDALRALYKDAGLDDTKDIIVYCRIGERSAHSWFVLHELLGYPRRPELRRLLGRVRLAGRRPGRGVARALTSLASPNSITHAVHDVHRVPSDPRRAAGCRATIVGDARTSTSRSRRFGVASAECTTSQDYVGCRLHDVDACRHLEELQGRLLRFPARMPTRSSVHAGVECCRAPSAGRIQP